MNDVDLDMAVSEGAESQFKCMRDRGDYWKDVARAHRRTETEIQRRLCQRKGQYLFYSMFNFKDIYCVWIDLV